MVVLRFKGNISGSLALLGIHKVAFLYAVLIKLEGELTVLQRISFHILLRLQHCLSSNIGVREACRKQRFWLLNILFLSNLSAAYHYILRSVFFSCYDYSHFIDCFIVGDSSNFSFDFPYFVLIRSFFVILDFSKTYLVSVSNGYFCLGRQRRFFCLGSQYELERIFSWRIRAVIVLLYPDLRTSGFLISVCKACRKRSSRLQCLVIPLQFAFFALFPVAYLYSLGFVFVFCYLYLYFIDRFIVSDSRKWLCYLTYFIVIRSFCAVFNGSKTYWFSICYNNFSLSILGTLNCCFWRFLFFNLWQRRPI